MDGADFVFFAFMTGLLTGVLLARAQQNREGLEAIAEKVDNLSVWAKVTDAGETGN